MERLFFLCLVVMIVLAGLILLLVILIGNLASKLIESQKKAEALKEELTNVGDKYEELEKEAGVDPLTGILNKGRIDKISTRIWYRNMKEKNATAVMMFDIDLFKLVNDNHGHQVGDKYLKKVAETVEEVLRPLDIFGRYGGDEFIIVLSEVSEEEAQEVAERVRKAVEELEMDFNNVTVSMGLACGIPAKDYSSIEKMIESADDYLYVAKKNGRNRVEYKGRN